MCFSFCVLPDVGLGCSFLCVMSAVVYCVLCCIVLYVVFLVILLVPVGLAHYVGRCVCG
jgi:hypothetical protein